MEKVKVSKEVASALDYLLNDRKMRKENLIIAHSFTKKIPFLNRWRGEYKVLNQFSCIEFTEILLNGYDIEKSFGEKVEAIKKLFESPHRKDRNQFDIGFDQGILATLEKLEMKIEGVNDKDYYL